jgi:hypothetical protein
LADKEEVPGSSPGVGLAAWPPLQALLSLTGIVPPAVTSDSARSPRTPGWPEPLGVRAARQVRQRPRTSLQQARARQLHLGATSTSAHAPSKAASAACAPASPTLAPATGSSTAGPRLVADGPALTARAGEAPVDDVHEAQRRQPAGRGRCRRTKEADKFGYLTCSLPPTPQLRMPGHA